MFELFELSIWPTMNIEWRSDRFDTLFTVNFQNNISLSVDESKHIWLSLTMDAKCRAWAKFF